MGQASGPVRGAAAGGARPAGAAGVAPGRVSRVSLVGSEGGREEARADRFAGVSGGCGTLLCAVPAAAGRRRDSARRPVPAVVAVSG